jgi:DNA topoisomerase VI subunit B
LSEEQEKVRPSEKIIQVNELLTFLKHRMQANFQQRIASSHCSMSSEFISSAQKPTGTVYRFIRVPEITQNTNTVVLIKNSNPTDANNIAKVQKHIQSTTPPTKIITTTAAPVNIDSSTVSNGGKKVKTRVSLKAFREL